MSKKKMVIIFAIVVTIIFMLKYVYRINNYIYLTQFGNTTSSQMMGYAIETRNGKIILVDGGTQEDSEQLEQYIIDKGGKVDAWFITHPHIDHAGAFEILSQKENIKIDKIYMSNNDKQWYIEKEPYREKDIIDFFEAINNEQIQKKIIEPELNEKLQIDNVKIKILGIKNPEIANNPINNQSMVIKMKVNCKKILFLGDTGTESSEKLINLQKKELKADIVQMSHHGQNGATKELYETIQPKICLWPTPEWIWNNSINGVEDSGTLKTKETRKWMEELGVKQNIIEKDGTYTLKVF